MSTFPTALDNVRTDLQGTMSEAGIHAAHHNQLGAAVNAVQAAFRGQAYNVKNYGAAGDGVANDATAINAAIAAASAAGGGWVVLPAGTYLCAATITLYTKVHLAGAGIEATILKLANGANVDLLAGLNVATLLGTNSSGGIYNWSVSHLTLEGNKSNNLVSGYGLRVYGFGYELHSVRVRNCRNDGIYTEWGTALGGIAGDGTMEAYWSDVMSHDNGGNGITMAGPHDSKWVNGTTFSNAGKGVYIRSNANMDGGGLFIANVHSWGNTQTYAFDCEGSISAINCEAEGAINSQLRLGSSGSDTYKASLSRWMGGLIMSSGGGGIGVEMGSGGFSPISCMIHTTMLDCLTALVKFTVNSAGGHSFHIDSYRASGPAVLGTADASDLIITVTKGGPVSLIQLPLSPTVPAAEGLQTAVATDEIRLKPGGLVGFAAKAIAAAVNYLRAESAAAGNEPSITAQGADADINLLIQGKGAGLIHIGQSGIALGGGATATLGTIGGSGPGGAAQKGWMAFRNNNVGVIYVPYW